MNTRPIPGWSGYLAADTGEIVSAKAGRPLKPWRNKGAHHVYLVVELYAAGASCRFYVHRLVCAAFHGDRLADPVAQVDHIDGDTLNNAPGNLRWTDAQGNRANQRRGAEVSA
ncbi:HNH endonuclease [bacterium]|nr:MAG: HNH endonuclease [bacterium]RIK65421.1 MAG: hypothetical protein DCC64_01935 [Planctomycetota bacterium]